jgi:hypothetical protein
MLTLSELKIELAPYVNTLVIDDLHRVVRLVDVVETDEDYFWVYDTNTGIEYASCVGGWVPLKGFIRTNDYNRMVRIWNLNNQIPAI